MPNGGTITIEPKIDDGLALISVRDEGCGIPPEKLAKLGEPFYTTKQNGNGLGLMVTKKIIEEHEGTLNIQK